METNKSLFRKDMIKIFFGIILGITFYIFFIILPYWLALGWNSLLGISIILMIANYYDLLGRKNSTLSKANGK